MENETAMTLSPAAQAVLNAACEGNAEGDIKGAVVAALRAVADQVVPAESENRDLDFCFADDIAEWHQWSERMHTRIQLLAIAIELEGAN